MRRIRIIYLLLFLICQLTVLAQIQPVLPQDPNRSGISNPQIDPSMIPENPDSINNEVEIISLPPRLYMWRIAPELGNIIPIPVDTGYHHFQNSNLVEGYTGNYNYLGNLGAPRQNRIFFERRDPSNALFLDPYYFFVEQPEHFTFTNSNIPYTNLSYYRAGNTKLDGEERFKAYFSVNVNKKLAFGFLFDYLYGRGFYNRQATSFLKAGLFGSYISDKYQAHAIYQSYNMKMAENGGVVDDRYITDPEAMAQGGRTLSGRDIPNVLDNANAFNYNKNFYVYLNHRYNLGFNRDIADPANDTDTISEFVPVTSFIHTFKIERARHRFVMRNVPQGLYENTYIDMAENYTNDSTTYLGVKNTLGVALLEGFNRYAKAGLTAFISHKYNRYQMMDSVSVGGGRSFTENEVFVGGELSKREGSILNYKAIGEVGLLGKAIGQFRVDGNIDLNFRLWNDTVSLIARGSISNTLPAFYMRHYHSNHFWWDNENMDKEFRTRIEGELNIARWRTNLKAGVENIKNYAYFGTQATPEQFSDNIQIVSAKLNQNFKLGILHLDNEVTWQKSSNSSVLPLPDLSLYHNLYIETKLARRVLTLQLGADVRYFTKYYAPGYSPATQQFHLQPDIDRSGRERVEIGGYPFINVYANFHLKRTRFFVMMYHVNQGMGDSNYFMAPHYPVNQRLLKLGLSWNFFD